MKYIKALLAFVMLALMMTSCVYVNYELEENSMTTPEKTEFSQTYELTETTDNISAETETYPEETVSVTESTVEEISVEKDGSYTSPEDVAEYIHNFGTLPGNFMTKSEAKKLGWSGGDLWKYADGMSIGGDRFGNYEGQLPEKKGVKYTECDIDTDGYYSRGSRRLVYSNDGHFYYTGDHYETFKEVFVDENNKVMIED